MFLALLMALPFCGWSGPRPFSTALTVYMLPMEMAIFLGQFLIPVFHYGSSLDSGRSLAWDHFLCIIADPCGIIAYPCTLSPIPVVLLPFPVALLPIPVHCRQSIIHFSAVYKTAGNTCKILFNVMKHM